MYVVFRLWLTRLLVLASLLLLNPAQAGKNFMHTEGTIQFTGDILKVCSIVYSDFSVKLRRYADQSSRLERHLASVDNYDVVITSTESIYVIEFAPRRLDGEVLKGGGARYEVSRRDSKIVKFVLLK